VDLAAEAPDASREFVQTAHDLFERRVAQRGGQTAGLLAKAVGFSRSGSIDSVERAAQPLDAEADLVREFGVE